MQRVRQSCKAKATVSSKYFEYAAKKDIFGGDQSVHNWQCSVFFLQPRVWMAQYNFAKCICMFFSSIQLICLSIYLWQWQWWGWWSVWKQKTINKLKRRMYGQTFCLSQLPKVNTSVSVAQILQNNLNLQHIKMRVNVGMKVKVNQ